MSDLQEIDALRPAPRATSPLALWALCAVAIGGIWLLREGTSQMPTAPITSIAEATSNAVTRPAIVANQPSASAAGLH